MSFPKMSIARAVTLVNATDIQIDGAWMSCKFFQNRFALIKVVMLAETDFDEPAKLTVSRKTVERAALYRFKSIEACRN